MQQDNIVQQWQSEFRIFGRPAGLFAPYKGRGWEAFHASTRRHIAHKPLGSQTNRLRFNGAASYYLLGWVKLHKCVCGVVLSVIFVEFSSPTNRPGGVRWMQRVGKLRWGFFVSFSVYLDSQAENLASRARIRFQSTNQQGHTNIQIRSKKITSPKRILWKAFGKAKRKKEQSWCPRQALYN